MSDLRDEIMARQTRLLQARSERVEELEAEVARLRAQVRRAERRTGRPTMSDAELARAIAKRLRAAGPEGVREVALVVALHVERRRVAQALALLPVRRWGGRRRECRWAMVAWEGN